ncbi:MAG: TIGR00297 family protein [Methanosarcinaceae archaeon]|nr:TIGR00297 family protein [Methanosarcinaceae archaeon]
MSSLVFNDGTKFPYRLFYIFRYILTFLFIISAGIFEPEITLIISLLFVIFVWLGGYNYIFVKIFGSKFVGEAGKDSISGNLKTFSLLLFTSLSVLYVIGKLHSGNLFFIVFQALAITVLNHESTYAAVYDKLLPIKTDENGKYTTTNRFSLFFEMVLILLRFCAAFLISLWFLRETNFVSTAEGLSLLFFISVIGTLAGSLFEIIRSDLSRDTSVYVGTFLTILAFFLFEYAAPFPHMLLVILFSLFLAILAFWVGIADFSALLSAAILGIIIILFSELEWYILLLMFFILGGIFTKYKFDYKRQRGISEGKSGIRNYVNVFANSLPALFLAVMYGVVQLYPDKSFLAIPISFAYVGTIANATGDTLASEIGTTTNKQTYMITTLKKVEPGQDGGVSLLGELACLFGSLIIGIFTYYLGIIEPLWVSLTVSFVGGFVGTNIDSFLGATLQNKKLVSNSDVNLISTTISAFLCSLLYFILF